MQKRAKKPLFSCHDPYFEGYFWFVYFFHREDSKISKMTKYDEFIIYFQLEKLTKIVNLCKKNGPKGPFLHIMTHISKVISH